jgi:hypothetical protein
MVALWLRVVKNVGFDAILGHFRCLGVILVLKVRNWGYFGVCVCRCAQSVELCVKCGFNV